MSSWPTGLKIKEDNCSVAKNKNATSGRDCPSFMVVEQQRERSGDSKTSTVYFLMEKEHQQQNKRTLPGMF